MEELDYKVIASGSKGNCVVIGNVMVDCGVPYKKVKEYLYDIDVLLYTHAHGDHFREATFKRIRKEFPNISIAANETLWEVANTDFDVLIKDYKPFEAGGLTFTPFPGIHDVEVHGFDWYVGDLHIIYMTDSNTLEYAPCKDKYDYCFIESNHDEKKLQAAFRKSKSYGYNAYSSGKRHLSTHDSKKFYLLNRRSKESEWIELHKSERFY